MEEKRSESKAEENPETDLPVREWLEETRWTWRYRHLIVALAFVFLAMGIVIIMFGVDVENKIIAALEIVLCFALLLHLRCARSELISLEFYFGLKRKLEQMEHQQEAGRQVLFDLQQFEKDLLNERTPNSLP
jgi:hypothetical protein